MSPSFTCRSDGFVKKRLWGFSAIWATGQNRQKTSDSYVSCIYILTQLFVQALLQIWLYHHIIIIKYYFSIFDIGYTILQIWICFLWESRGCQCCLKTWIDLLPREKDKRWTCSEKAGKSLSIYFKRTELAY